MPRFAAWVGLIAHAAAFVWYAASGLVAPGWAVGVLLGIWLALSAVAVRLWRSRPALLLLLPVVDAVVWVTVVSLGEAFLGWTA